MQQDSNDTSLQLTSRRSSQDILNNESEKTKNTENKK
jgi:hypothetical protein